MVKLENILFATDFSKSADNVLQYATSLAASAQLAREVLDGQPGARDRYLGLLRAGGSQYPYDLLKRAGVDLASPAPYRALEAQMNWAMDEIEKIAKGKLPAEATGKFIAAPFHASDGKAWPDGKNIAFAHWGGGGGENVQQLRADARTQAEQALALAPNLAEAHLAIGYSDYYGHGDYAGALSAFAAALKVRPNDGGALAAQGYVLRRQGRFEAAIAALQQALARDPRSPGVLVQIAISYWHQRKYDETQVWAQRALDVDPKHVSACQIINKVYLKIGNIDRFAAWTVSQAIAWALPEERVAVLKRVTADMQQVYATGGLSGVRRFMVDQITNPQLDFDVLLKMAFFRAVLYGAGGRLNEAFDCLDQAIASRDPALVHLAVAPEWDSMRGDHGRGAGQPDERRANRLRDPLVQFVGNDAADVICLEDLRVLAHFGFPPLSPPEGTCPPHAPQGGLTPCTGNEPTGQPHPPGRSSGPPQPGPSAGGPASGHEGGWPRSSGDERRTRR